MKRIMWRSGIARPREHETPRGRQRCEDIQRRCYGTRRDTQHGRKNAVFAGQDKQSATGGHSDGHRSRRKSRPHQDAEIVQPIQVLPDVRGGYVGMVLAQAPVDGEHVEVAVEAFQTHTRV